MSDSTLFTIRAIIAVLSVLMLIAIIILGVLANRKLHPKRKKFQGVDLTEIFGKGNEPDEGGHK